MKSKDIDSLDLIREFLNTKDALYCEIELIIFALCVAAVTISVESIIESYISVYESRNSKIRPITEEHAHHEMIIAINGPELCNADNVIKKVCPITGIPKSVKMAGTSQDVQRT